MNTFAEDRIAYLRTLGFFWTHVFKDEAFLTGYADSMLVELRDMAAYADSLPDYLSRKLIPLKKTSEIRLFVFRESSRDTFAARYGQDFAYGSGELAYGDLQPVPTTIRYDIEEGFSPNFLRAGLDSDIVLQKDVDYFIDNNIITFKIDPVDLPDLVKTVETLSDGSLSYVFFLWGFGVEEDVKAVCDFYGIIAGVCGETSQKIKDAINLAWDLRVDGASVLNVVRLLSMITDVDTVDEEGVVEYTFTEGDRSVVATQTKLYSAPLEYQPIVSPGDRISPGDVIFDSFSICGPRDELLQSTFEALALGPGEVLGVDDGILLVNDIVPIESTLPAGYRTIRVTT